MSRQAWYKWVGGVVLMVVTSAVPVSSAQPPKPNANFFNPLEVPGLLNESTDNLVTLSGEYKIFKESRDGILSIKASIKPGWHVYSTTQKAGGPLGSRIKIEASKDFQLTRPFVADRLPEVKPPDVFPVPSEEFSNEVVWNASFRLADSVDPSKLSFVAFYDGQACQDGGSCVQLSKLAVLVKFAGELPATNRGEFSNRRIHAKIRGQVAPRTVVPGGVVKLTLTAAPAPDYHVYALADRAPAIGSMPALIVWRQRSDWRIGRPQPSEKPTEHPDPDNKELVQYYYEKPVSWTVELQVPTDAAPAGYELRGLIGYQTCTNNSCDPPGAAEFSATVAVVKAGETVDESPEPLDFKLSSYDAAGKLATESISGTDPSQVIHAPSSPQEGSAPIASAPPSVVNYSGPLLEILKLRPVGGVDVKQSMFLVLPTAFLAGFILNFMPCVLPVIGLKIVSFVQQAGHSRSRIFLLNLWYCAGLLSVFIVLASLAVFAGFGWGEQFQKPAFNIVLAAVVFAFALSFLGVWEIPLPGFVGSNSANKVAEQEGPVGAFAKGVLTTVLATPCSGPMLVPALAWALKQPPALTYTAFVCVGLGMSAPYLVVGAFPRLISLLPRPGEWMETFKQLMGFVLIGTVVYLLTFIPSPLVVPTVAFLMGLWAALWWVGRTPVWEELNKRIRAWALGGAFATLVGMFAFLWMAGRNNKSELPWKPYSRELLSQLLLTEKKTVFVDFTADWCLNCKLNERRALNVPQTKSFVESNRIATLKADMTFDSPHISELLEQLVGTTAIPVYAVFRPDDPYKPIVMSGIISQSHLLETLTQASSKSATTVVVAQSNDVPAHSK